MPFRIIILVCLLYHPLFGQDFPVETNLFPSIKKIDDNIYKITYYEEILSNMTPEQTLQKAYRNSQEFAVQNSCEVDVVGKIFYFEESNTHNEKHFFKKWVNISTNGIITNQNTIEQSYFVSQNHIYIKLVSKYNVKIRRKSNENFNVHMKLNRSAYENGDELELEIDSNKNAYITVFLITKFGDNEDVQIIFPINSNEHHYLPSDKTLFLPKNSDSLLGEVKYTIKTDESCTWLIKTIATLSNYSFFSNAQKNENGLVEVNYSSFTDWYSKIPADQIAETDEFVDINN